MRRPSITRGKLVALALIAGAGGACSPNAEDASDSTGQEEYVQQLQSELNAASASDPQSFNAVKPVKPILKCVESLGHNEYKAHFGYTNSASSSISIPVGFFNRFWPPPISRGQPTVFAPGSQADVVQVQFSGFSASIWVLGNHLAIATRFAKLCPAGGTGGSGAGGSGGTGGMGTGGMGTGGKGIGGMGIGGMGIGGMGTGGKGIGGMGIGGMGIGGMGTGGKGIGGMGIGGAGIGGAGIGGAGIGGNGTGGNGTGGAAGEPDGGVCTTPPTNCDDHNPCTIDSVDLVACACVHIAALNGGSCDDGNACTQVDSCQAGVCVGASPKTCAALDQCHIAGVCDPASGVCSNPSAPDGRICTDNNACTVGDICVSGICTMGTPTLCNAPDACHTAGVCDHTTGACSNPSAPDGTTCNDGNACTTADSCQTGVCKGGSLKTCAATDQCHIAGVCNPTDGTCSNPTAPNGAACSDNNACTNGDVCQAGSCVAGTAKTCAASDSCHAAGTCDPASGTCSNPPVADGTTCTDNNACTSGDVCRAGACVGGSPVVCPPATDSCHTAGTCSPTTGQCSSSIAPDGTTCDDGNSCTTGDACRAGVCTPLVSNPADHCNSNACQQCTFGVDSTPGAPDLCDSSPDGCFNCDPGTMGCDLLTDPADKVLCQNLYACLVAPTHPGTVLPGFCQGTGGDPLPCWCGTNALTCVTSNAAPTQANGPCLQQIFAAAKSTDAATINARFIDPSFPLGAAANLAICRGTFCAKECSLP